MFAPPPQFFQHLERSNDAASIIQHAFRQAQRTRTAYSATLEHAHQAQNPPTSNALTLLPANFPIGSHVTVVSSHPKHANAIGVVTRHTAKFVTFSPVDSPQDRIRILPQSLLLVPLATPSSRPSEALQQKDGQEVYRTLIHYRRSKLDAGANRTRQRCI